MITFLCILLAIVLVYTIELSFRVQELTKVINLLDKEQHDQNKDILNLIKYANESSEIISTHSQVLKYLVEGSPKTNVLEKYYNSIKGEA